MARVNCYLPDELHAAAVDHGLALSRILQAAIRRALEPDAAQFTQADLEAAFRGGADSVRSVVLKALG